MKLKTLKDMSPFIVVEDTLGEEVAHISLHELKQEAIKCVNHFRNNVVEMTEKDFLEFHNITEEDLKEKEDE